MVTRSVAVREQSVRVETDTVSLEGNLSLPEEAYGVVLFAHGSGSGRRSPRANPRHRLILLNNHPLQI